MRLKYLFGSRSRGQPAQNTEKLTDSEIHVFGLSGICVDLYQMRGVFLLGPTSWALVSIRDTSTPVAAMVLQLLFHLLITREVCQLF